MNYLLDTHEAYIRSKIIKDPNDDSCEHTRTST